MRYGIGILLVAFLAIIGMVLLIGRGGDNPSSANAARFTKIADYADKDSASVSWTQQGKLVGEDQRKAIRVIVTRTTRTVQVLSDYEEHVERSQDFSNTPDAFAAFVRALDNASFGKERSVKQPDERGICPLGNRFIYRLADGTQEIMRTWSDNCANSDGPFGGGNSSALIRQLFQAQITDYQKFVSGVNL